MGQFTKVKIKHIQVKSSNVRSIGHDGKDVLEVTYIGNGEREDVTWQYKPVTVKEFESLKTASSKGQWMHKNIRQNTRIEGKKVG